MLGVLSGHHTLLQILVLPSLGEGSLQLTLHSLTTTGLHNVRNNRKKHSNLRLAR
jgi:hypothetical protein